MVPFLRRDFVLVAACLISILFWLHRSQGWHPSATLPIKPLTANEIRSAVTAQAPLLVKDDISNEGDFKANSTLGFGQIIAVSTKTSPNRATLELSAELNGLKISIPDQPQWTEDDISRLKSKKNSTLSRGSAMAWLGHLNALKWFLTQPYETALIIEDDVDWDIHIRSHQIPLTARAFHALLSRDVPPEKAPPRPSTSNFWPPTKFWELLYLGHCGDFFTAKNLSGLKHTMFPDPTMSAPKGLHVDTQKFLRPLPVPPKHRMVHKSVFPLCSFAYAVSRATARKILRDLSHEVDAGTMAYDVRILEACKALGWDCWSVNPELFHHVDDTRSIIRVASSKPMPVVDDQTIKARARGTPNVPCGLRKTVEGGLTDVEKSKLKKMIRLAEDVTGICPISVAEVDDLRDTIHVKARDPLPGIAPQNQE